MDLQDGSGSETSEQSLQKLQSETDILAVTGVSCLLCYSWTMEYEAECEGLSWDCDMQHIIYIVKQVNRTPYLNRL